MCTVYMCNLSTHRYKYNNTRGAAGILTHVNISTRENDHDGQSYKMFLRSCAMITIPNFLVLKSR